MNNAFLVEKLIKSLRMGDFPESLKLIKLREDDKTMQIQSFLVDLLMALNILSAKFKQG